MLIRGLIFDIGGTVFNWQAAILESLDTVLTRGQLATFDAVQFANLLRERFLATHLSVGRGEEQWRDADEIVADLIGELSHKHISQELSPEQLAALSICWRNMPAWSGAREGIEALRSKFYVVPLTVLSWRMAVGSSRRNGINWDGLLSCDVLGVYKPDPRAFSRAAEILDARPEELMMVASHPSDLRAAIACGYRSAYVLPRLLDPGEDYNDTGFVNEFDFVARDFQELAGCLT